MMEHSSRRRHSVAWSAKLDRHAPLGIAAYYEVDILRTNTRHD